MIKANVIILDEEQFKQMLNGAKSFIIKDMRKKKSFKVLRNLFIGSEKARSIRQYGLFRGCVCGIEDVKISEQRKPEGFRVHLTCIAYYELAILNKGKQ